MMVEQMPSVSMEVGGGEAAVGWARECGGGYSLCHLHYRGQAALTHHLVCVGAITGSCYEERGGKKGGEECENNARA